MSSAFIRFLEARYGARDRWHYNVNTQLLTSIRPSLFNTHCYFESSLLPDSRAESIQRSGVQPFEKLSSLGIMGDPLNILEYHGSMVLRSLWGTLKWAPIILRGVNLSDSEYKCFQSGWPSKTFCTRIRSSFLSNTKAIRAGGCAVDQWERCVDLD